jgi:hypothetical protein
MEGEGEMVIDLVDALGWLDGCLVRVVDPRSSSTVWYAPSASQYKTFSLSNPNDI